MAYALTKQFPGNTLPYTHTGGDNAIASVGSAGTDQANISHKTLTGKGIGWSYDGGDPAGGKVDVVIDGVTVLTYDIAAEGPGGLSLYDVQLNWVTTFAVNLAAGGAGVIGKVNLFAE